MKPISNGHREIEFKATQVDPNQFKLAIKHLKEMVQQHQVTEKGTVMQEDYYLDHPGLKEFPQYELYSKGNISKTLRIRKEERLQGENPEHLNAEKENHSLCVKIARKGDVTDDHERREYEVKIDKPAEMLQMFEILGFSAEKIIKKTRITFIYKEYEIALDEVMGFKKIDSKYEPEFSSYILEVELKEGSEEVKDIPSCLGKMRQFIEQELHVTKYQQDQSGMENYM